MSEQTKEKKGQPRSSPTIVFTAPVELAEYIDRRCRELKPMISSRSHYLRILVEKEKSGDFEIFPKDDAQLQLAGSGFSA